MKLETNVIPLFRVILTEKSFSGNILVNLDDPRQLDQFDQKVNFKIKWNEMNQALGHLCAHIG